jgi:hypothetical protein
MGLGLGGEPGSQLLALLLLCFVRLYRDVEATLKRLGAEGRDGDIPGEGRSEWRWRGGIRRGRGGGTGALLHQMRHLRWRRRT